MKSTNDDHKWCVYFIFVKKLVNFSSIYLDIESVAIRDPRYNFWF